MSRKDVEESKLHFVPAKPAEYKREKPSYIEGINLVDKKSTTDVVEFHFANLGEITDNTNSSYAMKREFPNGRKEYFVKFATAGSASGKMLNPWGPNYQPGDEFKFETQMGRKKYEFRQVGEEIFHNYIQFLRTRNERYILIAEREINNAR